MQTTPPPSPPLRRRALPARPARRGNPPSPRARPPSAPRAEGRRAAFTCGRPKKWPLPQVPGSRGEPRCSCPRGAAGYPALRCARPGLSSEGSSTPRLRTGRLQAGLIFFFFHLTSLQHPLVPAAIKSVLKRGSQRSSCSRVPRKDASLGRRGPAGTSQMAPAAMRRCPVPRRCAARGG